MGSDYVPRRQRRIALALREFSLNLEEGDMILPARLKTVEPYIPLCNQAIERRQRAMRWAEIKAVRDSVPKRMKLVRYKGRRGKTRIVLRWETKEEWGERCGKAVVEYMERERDRLEVQR